MITHPPKTIDLTNGSYGRFYPAQRDSVHATIILLCDTPFPDDDGPLRLGFWLPMAGFHLLAIHVADTKGTIVQEVLAALNDKSLWDDIVINIDRVVLGGWGTAAGTALMYAAAHPHPAYRYLMAIAGRGSRPSAVSLSDRQLLLIGGWQDQTAPIEAYLLPLHRSLQGMNNSTSRLVSLDTDHTFNGRHFTLAKTIWEWLREVLPAAAAPDRDAAVSLREITADTARDIINLHVTPEQRQFVASNEISMAQAYFQQENAWFRAIYADEIPVGFLMLHDDPEKKTYYLWRFMIDVRYQGLGYGRQAVELLIEHVKTRPGADKLMVSCVPGEGSPCSFYEQLGFTYTGEKEGIELAMVRPL